jgi:NADH-quinone oxidoreductase E subunit
MSRLDAEHEQRAAEIIARYPRARSALLPLLHLAQEQDGYVAEDAMVHIAELLDTTPSEVIGTASFYTMFKREPVGTYLISVCTNIACLLDGGLELLEHAEQVLDVRSEGTTADGLFTLEEVECLAHCDKAPCVQVNYRFFGPVTPADFDRLCDDLRAGRMARDVPEHGVLNRDTRPHPATAAADGA